MPRRSFVTAINCMDGRAQEPVFRWMARRLNADHVDMITEPGPVAILSKGSNRTLIDSIHARIGISLGAHGSNVIAVAGHADCAGNPVEDQVQFKQIKRSAAALRRTYPDARIIGLWVNRFSGVELICDSETNPTFL